MPTNYPGALDTTNELKNDAVNATVSSPAHVVAHNNVADAIIAIETELGILPKGSFSSVANRLAATITLSPSASQTIQPNGDWINLIVQAHANQNAARLFEVQNSSGTAIAWFDRLGGFNAQGYKVSGNTLASTHLSDSDDILKNPSPSITTPTLSSPTFTGTPVSTTPPVDNNSTRIATTAYVIGQGYAKPSSPAFTGTPTAPTASVGTDTTQVATTAYVVNEIISRQTSSMPIGAVLPFAGANVPTGWLLCDGSGYSSTTYASLFDVIGYTYGGSDGTFHVPDMRGRMPVGKGTHVDVDTLGENEGVAAGSRRPKHDHTFSLSSNSVGDHTHGTGSAGGSGNHNHTFTGGGTTNLDDSGPIASAGSPSSQTTDSQGSHSHSASIDSAGSHTHSITGTIGSGSPSDASAYIVLNFIIKATQ